MTEKKPRRPRRTKASIVACIQQAAEEEIRESGFAGSLVTDIIRRAKIEPQVFYNRYKDLDEFYDTFVKQYDYWITDTLKGVKTPMVSSEGQKEMFRQILDSINAQDIILEILRWEVCEKNETTLRTASLREHHTASLVQQLCEHYKDSGIDIMGYTAFILSGLYYLSMHQKIGSFYGLNPSTDSGRERILAIVDSIIDMLAARLSIADERRRIADRLRQLGVEENIIERAIAD